MKICTASGGDDCDGDLSANHESRMALDSHPWHQTRKDAPSGFNRLETRRSKTFILAQGLGKVLIKGEVDILNIGGIALRICGGRDLSFAREAFAGIGCGNDVHGFGGAQGLRSTPSKIGSARNCASTSPGWYKIYTLRLLIPLSSLANADV